MAYVCINPFFDTIRESECIWNIQKKSVGDVYWTCMDSEDLEYAMEYVWYKCKVCIEHVWQSHHISFSIGCA